MAQEKMCPWCHTTKVSCVFTRGADAGIEYDCGTKVNSRGEPAHEGYNGDFYFGRNADCYERELATIKKKQEERDELVDALTKAWDDFVEDADFKWDYGCENLCQKLYDAVDIARSDLVVKEKSEKDGRE